MRNAESTALSCSSCGTRLRAGWYRCPRCRQVVTSAAPDAHVTAEAPREAPPRGTPSRGTPPRGRRVSTVVFERDEAPARARWPVVLALLGATAASASGSLIYELRKYPGPTIERPAEVAETRSTPAAAASDAVTAVDEARADRVVDADALVERVALDYVRWGKTALEAGDLEQARAQFDAALAAGMDTADVRGGLGEILLREGRTADALAELDRALALDGRRFDLRIARARARALSGQWTGAAEDYRIAAALRPQDYLTHYNLGLALVEAGRYDAAVQSLERAVALAPDRPALLVTLGTTYAAAGRGDLARGAFERFLALAPDDAEAPRVRAVLDGLKSRSER